MQLLLLAQILRLRQKMEAIILSGRSRTLTVKNGGTKDSSNLDRKLELVWPA